MIYKNGSLFRLTLIFYFDWTKCKFTF